MKRWSWIYAFFKLTCKPWLYVFYRKIEVSGAENIIPKGPVIYCINHRNAFLDALIPMAIIPRQLHSISRGDIFTNAFTKWLFNIALMIPVFRPRDGLDRMKENDLMFASAWEVLDFGGAIIMAPEGDQHADFRIRDLKSGFARMSLGAIERHSLEDVKIIAVGVNYFRSATKRTSVLVNFSEAISARAYLEQYQETPKVAFDAMRDELKRRMVDTVIHIDPAEVQDLAIKTSAIALADKPAESIHENFQNVKTTIRQVLAYCENLVTSARLLQKVNSYILQINQKGLYATTNVQVEPKKMGVFNRLRFSLAAPIQFYGILNHIPINACVPFLLKRFVHHPLWKESMTFVFYLFLTPLFWTIQTLIVNFAAGSEAALWYFLSLPLTGYVMIISQEAFADFGQMWRAADFYKKHPEEWEKWRQDRNEILAMIEQNGSVND